ncbi:Vitelline membrane outer layer protein 1 [Orchesella cincta]|uniref:Vitelline membrane outer layer protein 1 n=1 Tax=Orchesella cincta TaxID=48709 RepID=A0A1D2NN01_ORCCI|nr:Vitelline membrane outer layer protein 1 [Orchesella cincta]
MPFSNRIVTFIFVFNSVYNYGLVLSAGIPPNEHHFIESPKLSHWGEWGQLEHCPSDQVVVGMKLKVHEDGGVKDDTGLNAVKFYCQNPYSYPEYSADVVSITSLVGTSGDWRKDFYCPTNSETKYLAVGFQLRSESSAGVKDDTAGNNLKLICSDLFQRAGFVVLEGDGTTRGEWTKQQICWPGFALCGLQTQVEISRSMDTTGLNNLKVRCCKVSSAGNNTVTNTVLRSDESSSSEDMSSSMEHSIEKDVHIHQHQHSRGDHMNSEEGSHSHEGASAEESSYSSPAEQELIAIDPEPTEFFTHNNNESPIASGDESITTADDNSMSQHHHEEHSSNSVHSSEDDSLPEEIASIDQVDNSEAQHEEEESASTASSYSQHIPVEVINALEDADGADSHIRGGPNGVNGDANR